MIEKKGKRKEGRFVFVRGRRGGGGGQLDGGDKNC